MIFWDEAAKTPAIGGYMRSARPAGIMFGALGIGAMSMLGARLLAGSHPGAAGVLLVLSACVLIPPLVAGSLSDPGGDPPPPQVSMQQAISEISLTDSTGHPYDLTLHGPGWSRGQDTREWEWYSLPGHEGGGSFWLWPPVDRARKSMKVTVSTLWEAAWAEIELPRLLPCGWGISSHRQPVSSAVANRRLSVFIPISPGSC